MYDNVAKKRAYYGVPIEAQTMHIHYWRDLVKEAGMNDDPAKIPMDWNGYWDFWRKAQDALRKKDPAKYAKVYGLGVTESSSATDTIYNFEMALLSFGGTMFSDDGKVVADQGANREAIVKTLKFFADMFNSGYVPPDTLNWSDGDNNANFHSKSIVMTPNPSVSIPAHQFFNNPDNYFNKSATIEWPDGPDGKKPTYMVAVKTILIPKDSTNKDVPLAKEFIKFVLEPQRFTEYIKGANGRWFPVFKDVASDPFFSKGQAGKGGAVDPHLPDRHPHLSRAADPRVRALQEPGELPDLRGERLGQGDVAHQRGQVDDREGGRRGHRPHQDHRRPVAVRSA